MNCPPSQLLDELDRKLQQEWTEKIANRRTARSHQRSQAVLARSQENCSRKRNQIPDGDLNRIDLSAAFSIFEVCLDCPP